MIIDDSEALTKWLSAVLEPLCDADPVALTKYVLALIKKDKAETELRDSMEQQMEVFLQENTAEFIDSLFKTLSDKEYLNGPPKITKRNNSDDEDDVQEGKPDSTTSTPANVGELSSELKETDVQKPRRISEENRSRRGNLRTGSPPFGRGRSPTHRRRSSGHRGRYRSRSRSPNDRGRSPPPSHRRGRSPARRAGSPSYGRGRSRSYSRSPPRRYGSTPTRDEEPYNPSSLATTGTAKRQRCRDYDEKGFCLRGDQCKFDHGNDAVVLEDTSSTSVPPPAYLPGSYNEPYVPATTAAPVLPPLHLPPPGYANTEAPVAVSRKRPYDDTSNPGYHPPGKRFDYKRLGGRRGGRGGMNTTPRFGGSAQVHVKNIPASLNTIAHLNNHFTRFGTLVNVQIHFEGDPSAALVSFTHPHEATAALNSPDAVLGNRFIKMFYYQQDRGSVRERLGSSLNEKVIMDGKTITKTILNNEVSNSNSNAGSATGTGSGDSTAEASSNIETISEAESAVKETKKLAAIAAIKKNQEVLESKFKMKKEAETKKAEVLKKSDVLRKSKQDLLDKLIDQQKQIIQKMEEKKSSLKPEEKTQFLTIVKDLQARINSTQEDLKQIISQQTTRKSFSDVQKELLDAELELFNAQQDGAENTEEIQKRVNALRIDAAQKGLLQTSRHPRGRGAASPFRGFRGRGYPRISPRGRGIRGGFRGRGAGRGSYLHPGMTSLDRRPTTILIAEVEEDEKENLLEYMGKFGEVMETVEDEDNKALIVQYKSRREAEIAMLKATKFNNRDLKLTWHNSSSGENVDQEHEESEHSGLDEHTDVLDDYDVTYNHLPPGLEEEENKKTDKGAEEEEEEEDEDAERSWKR